MINREMITKVFTTIFLIAAIIFLVYEIWPEKEVVQLPGVLAPQNPVQVNMTEGSGWIKDDYFYEALAQFKIKAKVLCRSDYNFDDASSVCPTDLALGWGRMSDQTVVDKIHIWQGGRWYKWKADKLPIPKKEIETHSANMHIIPAGQLVQNVLDQVALGEIIEIEGYLVDIKGPGGWRMRSSTSRTDRGDGACEVVWVEKLTIVQ